MTSIAAPAHAMKHVDSQPVPVSRGGVACLASAVAAALIVGTPIATTAPAQAGPMFPLAPACDGQYEFKGSSFTIKSNKRKDNMVYFPASRQTVGPGQAEETYITEETYGGLDAGGLVVIHGNASGGIKGRDIIDITVNWTSGPPAGTTSTFTGRVDNDGYARGPGWQSADTLSCIEAFVPGPVPPIPPPPRPEPPPAPPPEIKVSWAPYDRGPFDKGIRATVSITNNENKPTVGCVYKYELGTRSFTVTGSQEAHIDFPGFPLQKFWPVTVTCNNGLKYEGGTTY